MSFIEQLMQDAKPKAVAISNTTSNIADTLMHNKVVQVSKTLGYKGLVNTVGIGLCLAEPLVVKSKALLHAAGAQVEKLAQEAK